jgi:hypothetical protein
MSRAHASSRASEALDERSGASASEAAPYRKHAGRQSAVSVRPAAATGIAGRRTVTIRGRGSERYAAPARSARRSRRAGARPDRIAMWAVLLGVLLVLAAATSSHAAVGAKFVKARHATSLVAHVRPSARP